MAKKQNKQLLVQFVETANIQVHAAQKDSILSACGMTHVAQTPLLSDVTCAECLTAMVQKMWRTNNA
jgi:hypothetical protein